MKLPIKFGSFFICSILKYVPRMFHISEPKRKVISKWLQEANGVSNNDGGAEAQFQKSALEHRDLRLHCSDGTLAWSSLFLRPLVSKRLWEAVVSIRERQCQQVEQQVHLVLPDFDCSTAR